MYMTHAHGARRKNSHAIEIKFTGVKSQKKVYAPAAVSLRVSGEVISRQGSLTPDESLAPAMESQRLLTGEECAGDGGVEAQSVYSCVVSEKLTSA